MGFEKCMGNWHSQFSLLHLSIFQQLYIISFHQWFQWHCEITNSWGGYLFKHPFFKGIWPIGKNEKKSDKTTTEWLRVLFKWYLWAVAKCISIVKLRFGVSECWKEREGEKMTSENFISCFEWQVELLPPSLHTAEKRNLFRCAHFFPIYTESIFHLRKNVEAWGNVRWHWQD